MQKWNLLKKTAPCILSLAVAATTFPTAVMASDLDAAVVSEAEAGDTEDFSTEETAEDIDNVEDAEDEVKWAEKVICNFGVYAGTPLGEMMQDARGYQTIKWLVQRYKGQNQEIQKAAKILLDHEKEMQKAA